MLVQLGLLLSPGRSSMLLKEEPSTTLLDKQVTRVYGKARYTSASQHVPCSSLVFLNLASHFVGTIQGPQIAVHTENFLQSLESFTLDIAYVWSGVGQPLQEARDST